MHNCRKLQRNPKITKKDVLRKKEKLHIWPRWIHKYSNAGSLEEEVTIKPDSTDVWPMRWGVDTYGSVTEQKIGRPAEFIRDFGFDLWVRHFDPPAAADPARSHEIDGWCAEHGLHWVLNMEGANWEKEYVDGRGRDWYNRADGRHFELFPDEILQDLGRCKRLLGLMYDEAEHMQNCRNAIAKVFKPFMFDPSASKLENAADDFTAAVRKVAEHHGRFGLNLFTEHVFPVLFHGFARGGFTAATKIMKENWNVPYIACAMGAALQYGKELWITPDFWWMNDYPGHTAEEYRSALLLAYHVGADAIYTETLAYDDPIRNKRQIGSLIKMTADDWEVTELGRVAQWFRHEYVPAHPRRYSFRQVRPRVVIVRQPDACWGQATSWLPDTLFGHESWQSTPVTEGWLRIWHLLTRGVVPADTLSWHAGTASGRPYQVFCPADGVVVFDHHVGGDLLEGAEVIFLTGLGVSAGTLEGIEHCVSRGAVCAALPHLLPARLKNAAAPAVVKDGGGQWVITADFLAPHVRKAVMPVLPAFNEIHYRFGDTDVAWRMAGNNPNHIEAEVREAATL